MGAEFDETFKIGRKFLVWRKQAFTRKIAFILPGFQIARLLHARGLRLVKIVSFCIISMTFQVIALLLKLSVKFQ